LVRNILIVPWAGLLCRRNNLDFPILKTEVYKPADMTPEEFRQKLSDRFMVKFSVKVMDDDD
jgi:hypothetical protein